MELPNLPADIDQRYTKSWTAYASPTWGFLILLLGSWIAMAIHPLLGGLLLVVSSVTFALKVLAVASIVLYTDRNGVRVYQGVFPWSRGVTGVIWRDVEDATYVTGLFSWLFDSYSVRIGHRFTKTNEIHVSHIANGRQTVIQINDSHRRALRQMPGGN